MFKQFLFNAVQAGASHELSQLLEKFRELNGEEKYLQLVETLRNEFLLLESVAETTKTKSDDTVVSIVLNALPK